MHQNHISHGIMFHHFHDRSYSTGQGSINTQEFDHILNWLSEHFNLIGAEEYLYLAVREQLTNRDVCITLDDALKCQYEVALPILNERKLDAFFFVYSAPLLGSADFLEIFRYFRNTAFKKMDDFYQVFFNRVQNEMPDQYLYSYIDFLRLNYLSQFAFYTRNDRWFRYLRDHALGKEKYEQFMLALMQDYDFEISQVMNLLWLNEQEVIQLAEMGHSIGLHSYSHPTMMHKLSLSSQQEEYKKNYEHLADLVGGQHLRTMSHPCGHYNQDTLAILRKMGIQLGFRSSFSPPLIQSELEIPRKDHSDIIRMLSL